ASSSGYGAVMKSSTQQKKMEAVEQDEDMLFIHKNVAGRAFTLKDGIWVEHGVDAQSKKIIPVKFMEKDYIKLLNKSNGVKKILALGIEVVFEWQGKVYKVIK
ncbi:MAG: hypothetical protein DRI70_09510, partial [Bacteroidetes bacterium]